MTQHRANIPGSNAGIDLSLDRTRDHRVSSKNDDHRRERCESKYQDLGLGTIERFGNDLRKPEEQ